MNRHLILIINKTSPSVKTPKSLVNQPFTRLFFNKIHYKASVLSRDRNPHKILFQKPIQLVNELLTMLCVLPNGKSAPLSIKRKKPCKRLIYSVTPPSSYAIGICSFCSMFLDLVGTSAFNQLPNFCSGVTD